MKQKNVLRNVAKIAILASLAAVLNLFTFPLPIFPPFYELDLSDAVVLIGGFAMGPWAVVIMEAIKQLINITVNGSITAFVGELANFLMGLAFVLPASLFYQKKKTQKRAFCGIGLGLVSLVIVSALLNYFFLIPTYSKVFGFDAVLKMSQKVIPAIQDLKTLVLFATVPFNLMKGLICSFVTVLLYKRISPLLHK